MRRMSFPVTVTPGKKLREPFARATWIICELHGGSIVPFHLGKGSGKIVCVVHVHSLGTALFRVL